MPFNRCSTLEQVKQEFIRTMKSRMLELNLNRKMVASMACCDVSNVAHVLGGKREVSLATMLHFADKLGISICISFVPKEASEVVTALS